MSNTTTSGASSTLDNDDLSVSDLAQHIQRPTDRIDDLEQEVAEKDERIDELEDQVDNLEAEQETQISAWTRLA